MQIIDDSRVNVEVTNIVDIMKNTINSYKNNNQNEIDRIHTLLEKRKKVIKRMINKRGDENLLIGTMLNNNAMQDLQIEKLLSGISDFDLMLDMLDNYEYDIVKMISTNTTYTTVIYV